MFETDGIPIKQMRFCIILSQIEYVLGRETVEIICGHKRNWFYPFWFSKRLSQIWAIWNAYFMSQLEWSPWANKRIILKMSQLGTSRRSISAFYLMPMSQIPLTCLNFARFGSHLSRFSREIGPVWFSWKCKFCPHFPDLKFTVLKMFIYENQIQLHLIG